jgi:hypothetical protein
MTGTELKVRFEKKTTYGTEWTGFVKNTPVYTIKRKNGRMFHNLLRYDYDLTLVGSEDVLERSCYFQDVVRRARSHFQSVIVPNGFQLSNGGEL